MFAIELQSPGGAGNEDDRPKVATGTITVGGFTETFRAPLGYWDESGYRRSWQRAFDVLSARTHAVSCLMTSMTDPCQSNYLVCWPMYRTGEDVHIQNAIIFLGTAGKAFDPAAPWDHVEPRRTADEDGNKISEWTTPMDSLRQFFG